MKRLLSAVLASSLLVLAPACKKDPATPEYWTQALERTKRAQDRVKVVDQLRASGHAKAGFLPMLHAEFVRERQARVRASLARLMGEIGDPSSIEPLSGAIEVGATDADGNALNREIAMALARIGEPSAVPVLQKLFGNPDPYTRIAVMDALGDLRASAAAPLLEALAEDTSAEPFLSKKAIETLGAIGAPSSVPVLIRMMFQERPGISFYPESAFALYRIGGAATPALMAAFKGEDAELRTWARAHGVREAGIYAKTAQVLGDLHVKEAEPLLLQRLAFNTGNEELRLIVRMFSADALGRMGSASASGAIAALLTEPEPTARLQYLRALVRIGSAEALPAITVATSDDIWEIRETAARALALLGGEAQLAAFRKLLESEAARTAAECEDANAPGCGAPDVLAKERVATLTRHRATLAASTEVSGTAGWEAKLGAPGPGLRERAAYELGRSGSAAHLPALAVLTRDPDLDVRVAAFQALDLLTNGGPEALTQARSALPSWKEQLQRESGETRYVRVNQDLRRLVAKLER